MYSLTRHGVNCPKVVVRKKHVLAMSFIGHDGKAAPKLHNAQLSVVDLQMAYEQCIEVSSIKMLHYALETSLVSGLVTLIYSEIIV